MKRRMMLWTMIAGLLMLPGVLYANTMEFQKDAETVPADVTGVWTGSFDLNGTDTPVTMKLKSSGATVTGAVEGLADKPIEIHDGKIEGDIVTFWLNADYGGQTYAVTYKGKVSAAQIEFAFGVADGSWSTTMTVKKTEDPAANSPS